MRKGSSNAKALWGGGNLALFHTPIDIEEFYPKWNSFNRRDCKNIPRISPAYSWDSGG